MPAQLERADGLGCRFGVEVRQRSPVPRYRPIRPRPTVSEGDDVIKLYRRRSLTIPITGILKGTLMGMLKPKHWIGLGSLFRLLRPL